MYKTGNSMKHFKIVYEVKDIREVDMTSDEDLTEEQAKDLFWKQYLESNLGDESESLFYNTSIEWVIDQEEDE